MEEERVLPNVAGKLGKKKLDTKRIAQIQEATFQMYPLETGIKSIDESCRRLNRKTKGKENVIVS